MTSATITSIGKYIQLKDHAAKQSARSKGLKNKTIQSSSHPSKNEGLDRSLAGNDRYATTSGQYHLVETRLARQNRAALSFRDADRTMYEVAMRIHRMEEALNEMIKHYPPYPPGSEERIEALKKVNTFRKQIELLTLPPSTDQNTETDLIPLPTLDPETNELIKTTAEDGKDKRSIAGIFNEKDSAEYFLPEITENADDGEIKASIVQLREAGAFIRRQRRHFQSETSALYQEKGGSIDKASAEFKSLFIGKHLSNNPYTELTVTQTMLTGYLS